MSNYEFAIKHRQAFIVFCQGVGECANPHNGAMTSRFRKAVEKQLKTMRAARPAPSKAHGFALIGEGKATMPAPAGVVTTDTFAVSDTPKPRKNGAMVMTCEGYFL